MISIPAPAIWRSIATYYAIACAVSWAIWSPMILGQDGLTLFDITPSIPLFISLGTIGPLLASFITHRLTTGNWRAVRFLPAAPRDWIWLLAGPLLVLVCFFVLFPMLIVTGPPTWSRNVSILAGLPAVMFSANLFGGPLFEEFGWRGFLQPRLQQVLPPWLATVVVGVLWPAWHWPLFFLDGWSSAPPVSYLAITIGLSVLIGFAFNTSGESVVVAILMHAAFNSSPRFLGPYLEGSSTRAYPSGEWLLAGAFLFGGAVLAIATRGRLGARPL